MIRTHILLCKLDRKVADAFNTESGHIYSNIVEKHWDRVHKKGLWLSTGKLSKLSDMRVRSKPSLLHAHSIDAAQEGFFEACNVTRALRKAGFTEAKYPYHQKRFRTTVWKSAAIKRTGRDVILSNGRGNDSVKINLPDYLQDSIKIVEIRLVYEKESKKYFWHIVVENGKEAGVALGENVVSVDLGEIHPAVVGDEVEATIITCRERRSRQQGHAKRLASLATAIARKTKNSRKHKRLLGARTKMNGKHKKVMLDIDHKISKAIVDVAQDRKANLIVFGDVRDIADEVNLGSASNQKISQWSHGKEKRLADYKAKAVGIRTVLGKEDYTSQTCPVCGRRHKCKGRCFICPFCNFRCHRDVVGQINILSVHKYGEPGKIPAPSIIKYRIPQNLRVMRRCVDTRQTAMSVACSTALQEAVGL